MFNVNNLCEELNPNNFIYFQYSYLDHLKNYYLENNNIMDECLLFKAFERCDYIPEEQMREIKWEIILVVN